MQISKNFNTTDISRSSNNNN